MQNNDHLETQAVDAAINLRWNDAISLNKKMVKLEKTNLTALLRLGFAYLQLNQLPDAKKTYQKVLKIQSKNQIALDNIERIAILEQRGVKSDFKRVKKFDPSLFLEIPGKTKSSTLVNLGQKEVLAHLTIGDEVLLKSKQRKAEIRTENNEYIGVLPDDLSKRLYLFIKGDSEYRCYIKEVSLNKAVVFIREEKKGKKLVRYSSFPKNIQSNMSKVAHEEDGPGKEHGDGEDELDNLSESEVERMAENLTNEDKDYFFLDSNRAEEDEESLEE